MAVSGIRGTIVELWYRDPEAAMTDSPLDRWMKGDPDPFGDAAAFKRSIAGRAGRMQKQTGMTSETIYEVHDEHGHVVRRSTQILTVDEHGDTYVEYRELCDLPLGQYTIHPGPISVTVTPDMKPLG